MKDKAIGIAFRVIILLAGSYYVATHDFFREYNKYGIIMGIFLVFLEIIREFKK